MSEQDKFEPENRNEDPIDYNFLTNSSMGMIPISNPMSICKGDLLESSSCSSAPIVNSFPPIIWDHPTNSHNLAFCDINNNTQTNYSSSRINKAGFVPPRTVDMGWTPPNSLLKGGIYVPNPALSQFPADSGFIERAARFSCFGAGNFGDMMNPFSAPPSLTLIQDNSLSVEHGVNEGSPVHNEKKSESFVKSPDEAKESGEAEFSGGGGQEEQSQSSNKRKRSGDQDNEFDKVKGTVEPTLETKKGGQNPTLKNNRVSGKNGTDLVKEDYIHIRARRGQATNSHSLAERVRREKISERMKFLQDLVPGCSKVTGKAVMLDEIINYVQSLQRQVEFLSMKLATVNPRHDFNIEGLLAKDILQSQACSSSVHGFHHDRTMPYHHQQLLSSQAGLISNTGSYSNTLRRSGSSQLTAMSGGYKESTSQAPNVWEDELHNVIQLMGFNPSTPLSTQDLSGHMKDEP